MGWKTVGPSLPRRGENSTIVRSNSGLQLNMWD